MNLKKLSPDNMYYMYKNSTDLYTMCTSILSLPSSFSLMEMGLTNSNH